jgi:hypothetical protein
MGIIDNYRREREAERVIEKIRRSGGLDHLDDPYGSGKLTKPQKRSQEKHIPLKENKQSKLGRAVWG